MPPEHNIDLAKISGILVKSVNFRHQVKTNKAHKSQ